MAAHNDCRYNKKFLDALDSIRASWHTSANRFVQTQHVVATLML
jgi:hypothetical protein